MIDSFKFTSDPQPPGAYFADAERAGTWEIPAWRRPVTRQDVTSDTYDTAGGGQDRQPAAGVDTLPDGDSQKGQRTSAGAAGEPFEAFKPIEAAPAGTRLPRDLVLSCRFNGSARMTIARRSSLAIS